MKRKKLSQGLLKRNVDKMKVQKPKRRARKKVIREFHVLLKKKSQLEKLKQDTSEVDQAIEALGGLNTYQNASLMGAEGTPNSRSFDSPHWVITKLKKMELLPRKPNESPLKLLDVGSIKNGYLKEKGVESTAIDLHSQDESVIEQDLITWKTDLKFNIVVLSLVINFVGEPRLRGEMLKKAIRLLEEMGILIVVLPIACFENSRYFNKERFIEITSKLGLTSISEETTARLFMIVLQKTSSLSANHEKLIKFPRKLLRGGTNRNNFCIILQ